MSLGESDARLAAPSPARRRAYQAVQAVLSDDHNYEAVRLQGTVGPPRGTARANTAATQPPEPTAV